MNHHPKKWLTLHKVSIQAPPGHSLPPGLPLPPPAAKAHFHLAEDAWHCQLHSESFEEGNISGDGSTGNAGF